MRRYEYPFNGMQFLLNKNTGEIHNLDNESYLCQISEIKEDHIRMGDSYESCLFIGSLLGIKKINGCAYCIPTKNNG